MDRKIIALFDRYTHGAMGRRVFLEQLKRLAGSAAAATALLPLLENNYAQAALVAEDDSRIKTGTATFPFKAGEIVGYAARPSAEGRFGGVIVIHENRGLNAHIKDVARRFAVEGFVALAPDYLSPAGGTPTEEDKARELIGALTPEDAIGISHGAFAALKALPEVNGKVAAVGFCWGGGQVNQLAVAEPELAAAVAYYGMQPKKEDVPKIKAPLLLHYAGIDERINAGIADFETALKADGKAYELHRYEGANHAFNNDTNAARYDKAAADLAWGRTVAFLKKYLAG
ncbi:MAG: dienelactone hydrolase family protein [Parvibaculaceae bacterium]